MKTALYFLSFNKEHDLMKVLAICVPKNFHQSRERKLELHLAVRLILVYFLQNLITAIASFTN